jgi:hypothetical protein
MNVDPRNSLFRKGLIGALAILLTLATALAQQSGYPGKEARHWHDLFRFNESRGDFEQAIIAFGEHFRSEKQRAKLAKRMEDDVDVFLYYLNSILRDRPARMAQNSKKMDSSTKEEIASEVLALSLRIKPSLDTIGHTEYAALITVDYSSSLPEIRAELMRLKRTLSQLH